MRRSPLAILVLIVFVDLLGFGLVIPVLPFYATHLGASPAVVGVISSAYALAQLLCSRFWGGLSDRIGRRRVLLVTLAGSVVSMALTGAASSLAALFLARAFAGAMAANISVAQAYVADITTTHDRARGLGAIGAGIGLGFVVGPALGAAAASLAGPRAPFFLAAAIAASNLIWALVALPETPRRAAPTRASALPSGWRADLRDPVLGPLIAVIFLLYLAFSAMESMFALWTHARFGYGAGANGALFAFVGIVVVIVQGGLVRRAAPRWGERTLLRGGLAFTATGLLLLPLAGTSSAVLVGLGLLSVGQGVAAPVSSALASLRGHADRQGAVLGVTQTAAAAARFLGPLWGGLAFDHIAPGAPFVVGGGVTLGAWVLAWRLPASRVAHASQEEAPESVAPFRGEWGGRRDAPPSVFIGDGLGA